MSSDGMGRPFDEEADGKEDIDAKFAADLVLGCATRSVRRLSIGDFPVSRTHSATNSIATIATYDSALDRHSPLMVRSSRFAIPHLPETNENPDSEEWLSSPGVGIDTTIMPGMLLYEGPAIKISDVISSMPKNNCNICIIAGTVVFDKDLIAPGKDVTIVAPIWKVERPISINLSGEHAHEESGLISGGNGGNFYGIGVEFIDPNSLKINVSGGNGRDGQNGRDGTDGENGENATLEKHRAKKSKEGCEFYEGFPGENGGNATEGTKGTRGGHAGTVVIINGSEETCMADMTDIVGVARERGDNGADGKDGNPGHGGKHGDDLIVTDGMEITKEVRTRASSGGVDKKNPAYLAYSLLNAASSDSALEKKDPHVTDSLVARSRDVLLRMNTENSTVMEQIIMVLERMLSERSSTEVLRGMRLDGQSLGQILGNCSFNPEKPLVMPYEKISVSEQPSASESNMRILWYEMLRNNYRDIDTLLSESSGTIPALKHSATEFLNKTENALQFMKILFFAMRLKTIDEGGNKLVVDSIIAILNAIFLKQGSYYKEYKNDLEVLFDVIGENGNQLLQEPIAQVIHKKSAASGNFELLHEAAKQGYSLVIRLFYVGNGEIINSLDKSGFKTPLYFAMLFGHEVCVEELLSYSEIRIDVGRGNYKPIAHVILHKDEKQKVTYQGLFEKYCQEKLHVENDVNDPTYNAIYQAVEQAISSHPSETRDEELRKITDFLRVLGDTSNTFDFIHNVNAE